MCDDPRHTRTGPDHDLLHEIHSEVKLLANEVFGREGKKGLIEKVDDIREGKVTSVRRESAGWAAAFSLLMAGLYSVLAALGVPIAPSQQ